jgi:quinol monooxygenase YgiN
VTPTDGRPPAEASAKNEAAATVSRYLYMWIFQVAPGRVDDFLVHYRAAGTWALLFQRAAGYLGTRLLHDRSDPLRFLTIDEWESEPHYRTFRARFSAEYDSLDKICEGLTVSETPLGQFLEPVP